MDFGSIKTRWQSYSTRKKWLIGGIGALIVAAGAGAGGNGDRPNPGYGQRPNDPRGAPAGAGVQYRETTADYGEAQGPAGPGMAGPAMAGGSMASPGITGGGYAAPASGSPDVMSAWEARERSNDISARGFDQYIRDQTDVRDERTGEITTDVPNDVANPQIESGAYSAAPAADVVPQAESTSESAPE